MEENHDRRPVARQWVLVACLTAVSMLAQIDKNILVLMAGPIQRDFSASDVQISLLIGAAFAVSNIVVGLPAGWLADRLNRRTIIALGVGVWSLAVASNALASAFVALLVARIIVGGAEALIPPSSYSLIRDGVDERRRARALSVYTMSLMLGTGLSLVLGGPLVGAIQLSGIRSMPFIGAVSPWQITLFLVGVVGLPMSLLIFLAREPGRQQESGSTTGRSLAGVARYLALNRAIFLPLFIFAVFNAMITFGLGSWMPTMTARRFHLGLREIGLMQGSLLLTMGPLGLWLAGMAMDLKGKRSLSGVALVGVFVTIAVTVLTVMMCLIGSVTAFWIVDAMVVLFSWTFMAVTSTVVAKVAPASIVGAVMAIVLVLNGLIGQGSSPTVIALVSQHLFADSADALPRAMASVFAVAGAVALSAAVVLYRHVSRSNVAGDQVALGVHMGDAG
ncbi:MFS transporter [Burkholderia gladioli pv. gladioli]|uniref:MFS transporter n=1 Tax=Burkholderia gladioli TaxID=28095 RepID=A0A095F1J2_BURGA|nr:MFS transporter [Burkholderia gladioli]AJX00371.1 major Facilitator Superfamily protein [Burkholderia gladioli]ASD81415.1 MFS transporter [Burkholderia gladioli pv. gladioli]AWY56892.1 MFS transporter [Burkholderia gladioli pv. gladioli]KGC11203.1 major Facilitator Superfamily protein [Burkholderia gladioli]MDJ1164193.1 MFS transporter [Burkholderia gladioli pv. gladioli]